MSFSIEVITSVLVFIIGLVVTAKLSWTVSELSRDIWHYLGHRIPWLWRHSHSFHHRAFGRNFQVRSLARFREDRLKHFIPECIFMILCSTFFGLVCFSHFHSGFKWGCLYGTIHSLDELGRAIASSISPEFGLRRENLHIEVTKAPTVGRVTPGFHLGHHDRMSREMSAFAFCGDSQIFDKLIGTARSYRKLTFGFMPTANGLCSELRHCLESEGSNILMLPPCWSHLSPQEQHHWLNKVDVLVLVDF